MDNLKQKYIKEITPQLMAEFGFKNIFEVPKLKKVVVNVGISVSKKDDKYLELIKNTLMRITGQKPIFTLARKAISAFKIREQQVVGAKVTLRGQRMYDFVAKLINISLPRVRDFRGVSPKIIDRDGNLSLGFKEHISFAEIDVSEVELMHGLEISIATTAKTKEQGLKLFQLLGVPFYHANSEHANN